MATNFDGDEEDESKSSARGGSDGGASTFADMQLAGQARPAPPGASGTSMMYLQPIPVTGGMAPPPPIYLSPQMNMGMGAPPPRAGGESQPTPANPNPRQGGGPQLPGGGESRQPMQRPGQPQPDPLSQYGGQPEVRSLGPTSGPLQRYSMPGGSTPASSTATPAYKDAWDAVYGDQAETKRSAYQGDATNQGAAWASFAGSPEEQAAARKRLEDYGYQNRGREAQAEAERGADAFAASPGYFRGSEEEASYGGPKPYNQDAQTREEYIEQFMRQAGYGKQRSQLPTSGPGGPSFNMVPRDNDYRSPGGANIGGGPDSPSQAVQYQPPRMTPTDRPGYPAGPTYGSDPVAAGASTMPSPGYMPGNDGGLAKLLQDRLTNFQGYQNPLQGEQTDFLRKMLTQGSPYGSDLFKQNLDMVYRRLDDDYALGRRGINETAAKRGLYDSSNVVGQLGDAGIRQGQQKADLGLQLLLDQARNQTGDQLNISNALNQFGAQGQSAFGLNESAMSNRVNQATGYDRDLYDRSLSTAGFNNQLDQQQIDLWLKMLGY